MSKQVYVRYLNSTFLGHSAASHVLQHFNEETRVLNLSKMLQISMDGPSTYVKFSKELSEYRCECELNPLIDIGTCGLHIVHGAFKTRAESTSWDRKGVLKG